MTERLDLREWTAEGDRKPIGLVVVDGFRTRYSVVCVLAQIKVGNIYYQFGWYRDVSSRERIFVHGFFCFYRNKMRVLIEPAKLNVGKGLAPPLTRAGKGS